MLSDAQLFPELGGRRDDGSIALAGCSRHVDPVIDGDPLESHSHRLDSTPMPGGADEVRHRHIAAEPRLLTPLLTGSPLTWGFPESHSLRRMVPDGAAPSGTVPSRSWLQLGGS